MKTLMMILALILVPAANAATANLVLHLHDTQGHSFTYRTTVDGLRYADGSTPTASELAGHVHAAMDQMADELGYTAAILGPDHSKVLGAVKVVGAWLESSGDRRETLSCFRGENDRAE